MAIGNEEVTAFGMTHDLSRDHASGEDTHVCVGHTTLGLLGVLAFALHVACCAAYDHVSQAFWACHVALLLVSMGLLFAWPRITGVGALCLIVGVPAWLLNIAMGLEISPTSAITHLGGFALALVGLQRMGVAAGSWLYTPIFLGALQCVCRFTTPPALNINAAFDVYEPLQPYFSSYLAYEVTLLVLSLVAFRAIEFVLSRCFGTAATGSPIVPSAGTL